jgi:glycosyltransferase involved in cell wall biosynthesis
MWRQRRWHYDSLRRFDTWLRELHSQPPDVFMGPDLPYGGVRGHMRAIKRYSSLDITLVPDEQAMGALDRFTGECRERFMGFNPAGRPVVHSHVIPWYINWCREQQKRGLPWIHTYHLHYFPEHGQNGILRPDQIEINHSLLHEARHADIRLSVAKWQCDWLRSEHGIESQYLPNGVDVDACDRGQGKHFRNRHHLNEPFLLWVGRNDPVKNPTDFVRLAETLPKIRFVMIGSGLTARSLHEDSGVSVPPNLTLAGPATHAEVQDALAAASVLVVTSKREGLPTLVLEGMAHQKPVVVPDEPGCLEAVGDGAFGLVYRQGQIADLAEKTLSAIASTRNLPESRKRVLSEYDWRAVAPRLDIIYRQALNHTSPS